MSKEQFIEDYFVERKNTNSLKWDGMSDKFMDSDLLPLWVADMDFKVPKEVQQALKERIDHGVFGYSIVNDSYYDAFINWQKRRHQITVERSWIRFSTGVVNSFNYLIQGFSKVNEAVIVLAPVYYPFFDAVKENQRQLVISQLVNQDGQYTIDYEDFEAKVVKEKVKLFLFCSPQNPVGRIWRKEELETLFAICEKHDVRIIADEIHQDFIQKGKTFVSALSVNEKYLNRLFVLTAPSKTFNLASLLHSHVVIPNRELRKAYDQFIKTISHNPVSLMGMIATEAAYTHGDEWLNNLNQVIDANFNLMVDLFEKNLPKAVVTNKEATYLAWIDLSRYVTREELTELLEKQAKVAIDYGEWFDKDSGGFIRLNLATHPEIVKKATKSIIEVLIKR